MHAHYDQTHRFLTLEMGRLAEVVDTVDVPGGAAVLIDDAGRKTFPGYPVVGRLRGMAELRGVMTAVAHQKGYAL